MESRYQRPHVASETSTGSADPPSRAVRAEWIEVPEVVSEPIAPRSGLRALLVGIAVVGLIGAAIVYTQAPAVVNAICAAPSPATLDAGRSPTPAAQGAVCSAPATTASGSMSAASRAPERAATAASGVPIRAPYTFPAGPSPDVVVAEDADTPATIAKRFGVTVRGLLDANPFLAPDRAISPGTWVLLPRAFSGDFDIADQATGVPVAHIVVEFRDATTLAPAAGSIVVRWGPGRPSTEWRGLITHTLFYEDSGAAEPALSAIGYGVLCDYRMGGDASCRDFSVTFRKPLSGSTPMVGWSIPGSLECCPGEWFKVGTGTFLMDVRGAVSG